MKLTHVRLLLDDFAEAFSFYQDTLGLTCTFGDASGPYADFDTGPATLAIFTREAQATTTELRDPATARCTRWSSTTSTRRPRGSGFPCP